jgi:hypothetical protein
MSIMYLKLFDFSFHARSATNGIIFSSWEIQVQSTHVLHEESFSS